MRLACSRAIWALASLAGLTACGARTGPLLEPRAAADSGTPRLDARVLLDGRATCASDPGSGVLIVAGGNYDEYNVVSLAIAGAPCGVYTFEHAGSRAPSEGRRRVDLLRDGAPVLTVAYEWRTTISDASHGLIYTFEFPGFLVMTLRSARLPTRNLFALPDSLFDGHHVIVVP